jgi:hypothetical protein
MASLIYYPRICLEKMRKIEKNPYVREASVPVEVRAENIPNTSSENYRFCNLLRSDLCCRAYHVARKGEKRNAYRILVRKPEGKRPLGRPRRKWVDNIKMDLREIEWDGMDWIDLAQDRDPL